MRSLASLLVTVVSLFLLVTASMSDHQDVAIGRRRRAAAPSHSNSSLSSGDISRRPLHRQHTVLNSSGGGGGSVAVVTACYLYPDELTDVGFSYQFNIARMAVHRNLSAMYPNITLRSPAIGGVLSIPDTRQLLDTMIVKESCDVVIAVSMTILSRISHFYTSYVAQYPWIRFVENSPPTYIASSSSTTTGGSSLAPNVKGFMYSEAAALFAAGAAAAIQCRKKVIFVYPDSSQANSVNAFYRGMKYGYAMRRNNTNNNNNAMCSLSVMYRGNFFDPETEPVIADQIIQKGYDVIGYWSNIQAVTAAVKSRNAQLNFSESASSWLFTVPVNTNAGIIYGDTVLVSVMLTPSYILSEIVDAVIRNDTFVGVYENGVRTSGISHVSPRAERNASLAATAAQQSLVANYSLWCGGMTITNGSRLYEGCWTDLDWAGRVELEEGIISLGLFQKSTQCAAGTYASYNDVFALSCLPCPSGTYSTGAGEVACRVCPLLMIPNATQSGCVTVLIEKEAPVALIAALSVVLGSIFIASVVGAVTLLRRRQLRRRDPASLPPPRGPSVALLLITIDPTRSQPQWRQDLDAMCTVLDRLWAVVVPACFEHHGYVAASAGEVILLAAPCVEDGIRLAADIETGFAERSSSGVHVALRIIVTAGHTLVLRGVAIASVHQTATTPSLAGALSDRRASSAPANDVSFASSTDSGSSTGREQIRFVGTLVDSLISLSRSCVHPAPLLSSSSVVFLKIVAQGKDRDAQESFARVEEVWSRLFKSNESMVRLDDGHNAAFHSLGRVCWLYLEHGEPVSVRALSSHVKNSNMTIGDAPQLLTTSHHNIAVIGGAGSGQPSAALSYDQQYRDQLQAQLDLVNQLDTNMFTSSMLTVAELQMLVVYGNNVLRSCIRLLDIAQRRALILGASQKLHLTLDPAHAKKSEGQRVVYGEEYLRLHITLQLLLSLDEFELRRWVGDIETLHRKVLCAPMLSSN